MSCFVIFPLKIENGGCKHRVFRAQGGDVSDTDLAETVTAGGMVTGRESAHLVYEMLTQDTKQNKTKN